MTATVMSLVRVHRSSQRRSRSGPRKAPSKNGNTHLMLLAVSARCRFDTVLASSLSRRFCESALEYASWLTSPGFSAQTSNLIYMASKACCAAGAPFELDYAMKGSWVEHNGLKLYQIGSGTRALVLIHDIFGVEFNQVGFYPSLEAPLLDFIRIKYTFS
jgi:hypothetical protein